MEVLANSVLFTGSGSRQRKCKVLAVTFKGLINSSGDQEDECEVRQARPNFDMVLNCCENQRCSYHAHPSLATVSHILLSQYISLMTCNYKYSCLPVWVERPTPCCGWIMQHVSSRHGAECSLLQPHSCRDQNCSGTQQQERCTTNSPVIDCCALCLHKLHYRDFPKSSL